MKRDLTQAMTRRYACSLKGSRAYGDAPYQRGNNLTLIRYEGEIVLNSDQNLLA